MGLFDDETKKEITEQLKELKDNIKLTTFVQEHECQFCEQIKELVNEMGDLSDKIEVEIFDFDKDKDKIEKYGIMRAPAINVNKGENTGVIFYGIPGGYEFASFLHSLKEVSNGHNDIPEDLAAKIKDIDKDINIKVFVTLQCPYCPGAVITAHSLAMLNDKITGEMIEAQEFPELSQQFSVSSVPKIVINDKVEMVGAQPVEVFYEKIQEALG